MIVKICGLTNRADAEAAVEAGANAIGFNFHRQSPRYIAPTGAAVIGEKLDAIKVGVFVNEPAANVARIAMEAGLDVVQLHGTSQALGMRVWRACRAGEVADHELAEAILLDAPSTTLYGGTGQSYDWSLAKGLPYKVIVAGGLNAGNVALAVEQAAPWGVDACSCLESGPGVKDHEKMKGFIRAALAAAASLNL